VVISR